MPTTAVFSTLFDWKSYLLILSIGLSGCQTQATKTEAFEQFLPQFLHDKTFSINRTKSPLLNYRYEYGVDENGNDDSAIVKSEVSREQLSQQTLADYLIQNNLQYAVVTEESSSAKHVLKVYMDGTDWLLHYHFVLEKGVWYLQEVHDYSL